MTRHFDNLTEPGEILKCVKEAARSLTRVGKVQHHLAAAPGRTPVYKKLWSLSRVYLVVPVDHELEALGKRWCLSPSFSGRIEGAKVLGQFKDKASIRILKSLLEDPESSIETTNRPVPGRDDLVLVYRQRVYRVRQAAYRALRRFGVKIKKPIMEVLLEGSDL
jgi:hypothetical protein